MKVTVSDVNSWKKQIDVEVTLEEVQPLIEDAYKKFQKKAKIEGFRKGKVPLGMVKQRFGEAVKYDAVEDIIQYFYIKAVTENDVDMIAPGTIKDVSSIDEDPFKFSAEVEVEPEIKVSNYKGLKVKKEVIKVTDEDVDGTVDYLRQQKAVFEDVEGPIEAGYVIQVNIQATDENAVPIIGEKWDNRFFELGAPPFGKELETQMVGVKLNESKHVHLMHTEKNAEGKEEEKEYFYDLTVTKIQTKTLPELSDEFAQGFGEFKTMDEMEERIRSNQEAQQEDDAEKALRQQLADEIIRKNDFELPPSMVNNAIDRMWEDQKKRPNQTLTEDQFRHGYRSMAEWNIKWHLIWRQIAVQEELKIEDADLQEAIDKMVEAQPEQEKRLRSLYKRDEYKNRLSDNLLEEKVMTFIKENGKIKESKIDRPKEKESSIITS